jgi:hypothetical protein
MQQEHKLLASVVLFRELYDGDKDIYDVMAELLKAAIVFERKWSFNVTEAAQLLDTSFGFKIPEAVIKTTLKNRLEKKQNILSCNNGVYSIVSDEIKSIGSLSSELETTKNKQKEIIDDLIFYIESTSSNKIDEQENKIIVDDFFAYFLDDNKSKKYSSIISAYIIKNQNKNGFKDSLNAVLEGFVLYNGVRYTSNLNDLGSWKDNLIIYLDTEHLFNAVGYNGVLYKQLFDDFYGLVKEINHAKKHITLNYFDESNSEVENFFHIAELIIEGKMPLDPSKVAMSSILNGCETKSDIIARKSSFYSKLEEKRILLERKNDFYDEKQFNIESQKLLDQLKESNGLNFGDNKCYSILKMFNKINILRHGINLVAFEKIGYILMSGNSYAHSLSFNPLIKNGEKNIPFVTDIEFITNRFWFKLRKGFANQHSLPRSLDVVAKAQVVLSSQINGSVSHKFESMKKKYSNGTITKQEAEYQYHELRSQTTTPEKITIDNIESNLEFLKYEDSERHLREKSILEKNALDDKEALEEALKELENRNLKDKEKELAKGIFKIKTKMCFWLLLLFLFILSCFVFPLYFLFEIKIDTDTNLAMAGTIITFVLGLIPFFLSNYKPIKSWFEKRYSESIDKLTANLNGA